MTFEEYCNTLEFHPMSTLPAIRDVDFKSFEEVNMPIGIILRRGTKKFSYELIGSERAGSRTSGCSCCSSSWAEIFGGIRSVPYNGWAWVVPQLKG